MVNSNGRFVSPFSHCRGLQAVLQVIPSLASCGIRNAHNGLMFTEAILEDQKFSVLAFYHLNKLW